MENRTRRTPQDTVSHDGYIYYTSKRSNGTRYLRCSKYPQTRCQASGKVNENGEFSVIKGHHNHENLEDRIESRNFKSLLREACVREKGDLKNIYDKLATRNVEGALVVPFNSVRTSMQRWRGSTRPNIPADLDDLSRVLATGEWPRYSECSQGVFFSGLVRADGHSALIFGNQQFIGNFRESQYTFIDGTFKAVPRRPGFAQILTIFAICMDHAFPIFHIFMERRTRALYDVIFAYLLRTFDVFINRTIITDYEAALVASLRASYPEASLKGCFFHFCQALLRQAKALGIVHQIQGNANGRKLLRKYYALALLPAAMIEEAFNSLQGNNGELDNIFREFHNYVGRQWIQRDTPGHFSVFRQRHRTNNIMESYHRRLNSRLVRHPGIWDLMENLIEIQNIAALELEQLEQQGRVFRIATKNIVFNSRLDEAWDKLENGRFTIGDFLRQAVHFVANLDQYLEVQHEGDDAPAIPIIAPQAQPPRAQPLPHHGPIQNAPPPLIFFEPHRMERVLAPPPVLPVLQPNVPQMEPPPLIFFNSPSNLPSPEHTPNPPLDFPQNPRSPDHPPNPPLPDFIQNLSSPEDLSNPLSLDFPQNPPSPDHPSTPPSFDFPQNPPSPDYPPNSPLPDIPQNLPSPEDLSNPLSLDIPRNPPSPDHPSNPPSFDFPQNPPSPDHPPNSPLPDIPQNLPLPEHPPNPPSPEHPPNSSPFPVYDFSQVDRLFAQLTEEEDRLFAENPRFQRQSRWEPRIPAVNFDENSMESVLRCNICYLNMVQYVMTDCGHTSCTTCTDTLFNVQDAKCGICRMELRQEPCPIFFN